MKEALRRYGTLVVASTLAGLVGAQATGWLQTARGVGGPLIALAEMPLAAILALLVTVGLLAVIAAASARIENSAVGLFVFGWGIGVLAMRSGTLIDAAFLADFAPARIGAETLMWAILVAAGSMGIWRLGGSLRDMPLPDDGHNGIIEAVRGPGVWRGLAATIIALPIVWIVARTTSVGQGLGAAALGGVAVGVFGRMWAPHVQPVFLAAVAVAVVGIGQLVSGLLAPADFDSGIVTGTIPRLLRVMPITIAGGLVAGVAMGIGWARSFVTVAPEPPESSPGASPKPSPVTSPKPLRSARTA